MPPVIVQINTRKSIILGVLMLPIALFGLVFFITALVTGNASHWITFLALLMAFFFGGVAAYYFGLARRKPVALRMDDKGVSGYYTPPLSWQDISKIDAFEDRNHHRFLGIALHNPVPVRDRQSIWGRLASWNAGRTSGYHIAIPDIVLKDTTVEELAKQAKVLHRSNGI